LIEIIKSNQINCSEAGVLLYESIFEKKANLIGSKCY
jgi:hypothetical protein